MLHDSDWIPVATALKTNTTLQTLDLSSVGVGKQTFHHLATAMRHNTTLRNLDISRNKDITPEYMHPFYENPKLLDHLETFFFIVLGLVNHRMLGNLWPKGLHPAWSTI